MQTDAVPVAPLLRRSDNRQQGWISNTRNPPQVFAYRRFLSPQLFCIGHLLPGAAAAAEYIRARRVSTLGRRTLESDQLTSRVGLFPLIEHDSSFVARDRTGNEYDLPIHPSYASRPV